MESRTLGISSLVAGVAILAAGLILQFVVVPGQTQFPDDVERTRLYEGELAVLLDGEALASLDLANVFIRDVPITIDRTVETLEVDGGKAIVSDTALLLGPDGPIQASEDIYAIDRRSMEHIADFTGDERVIERSGLVIGFPIGTEQTDYEGFNGDTLEPNTIRYVGEAEVDGLATYEFRAASGPDVITDPTLLAQFPASLPKGLMQELLPALGLPEATVAQFDQILPTLPDPVPLTYTYEYETRYQIEPESGILVDYDKLESRFAALSVGDQVIPVVEVMNLRYELSDDSITDAVGDAEDARNTLFWIGRVFPYGAMIFGGSITLFGLGLLLPSRTRAGRGGSGPTIDLTDAANPTPTPSPDAKV